MKVIDNAKIIDKAIFYSTNSIKCHVKLIPTGFKNGTIISVLIDDKYYWFIEDRKPYSKSRLFLSEIYDIEDYMEEGGWKK